MNGFYGDCKSAENWMVKIARNIIFFGVFLLPWLNTVRKFRYRYLLLILLNIYIYVCMYILGTPEGPFNVTIISEVGNYVLSFFTSPSYWWYIYIIIYISRKYGLANDVTIIPKPGHLPTPDNRQGKQRTSGSDQVIWQGDKLHYWQFMELKSSISFVFFDCHSLKIPPVSRYEKHWETKFAIFFSLQNLPWTFFIIAFQLRSKARQSRRRRLIERLGISRNDPCATSHPTDSHKILLTSLGCAKMCQTCCEEEFMDAGQPFMRHDLKA